MPLETFSLELLSDRIMILRHTEHRSAVRVECQLCILSCTRLFQSGICQIHNLLRRTTTLYRCTWVRKDKFDFFVRRSSFCFLNILLHLLPSLFCTLCSIDRTDSVITQSLQKSLVLSGRHGTSRFFKTFNSLKVKVQTHCKDQIVIRNFCSFIGNDLVLLRRKDDRFLFDHFDTIWHKIISLEDHFIFVPNTTSYQCLSRLVTDRIFLRLDDSNIRIIKVKCQSGCRTHTCKSTTNNDNLPFGIVLDNFLLFSGIQSCRPHEHTGTRDTCKFHHLSSVYAVLR